jgi:DNA-binding XRE family transcriptional regulator
MDMAHLIAADVADTRATARQQIAQELENVRRRRESAQQEADAELDRLGALLHVAEDSGMRQHEIADRAGVSRQTLSNLRSKGRGTDRHWNIDLRILLVTAFHGAQSMQMLASTIGFPDDVADIKAGVSRLLKGEAIRHAGRVMSGQTAHDYYRITPEGLAQLPSRLHSAVMPATQRWAAYIATKDAGKINEAGQITLGQYESALIPNSTTHDMQMPEIAFYVEAASLDHAVQAASTKYAELRKLAGLAPEPAYITTLLPPDVRARNRAA